MKLNSGLGISIQFLTKAVGLD